MQVQFKRPVTLGNADGSKQATFGKGVHSVDEEMASGWFFDGLVKEGSVIVLSAQPVAKEEAEDKPAEAPKPVAKAPKAPKGNKGS